MDTVHDLNPISPCTLVLLLLLGAPAIAEDGVLLVHLTDPAGRPIPGIELELQGGGEAGRTDATGRARIRLADDATVGQWVSLAIAIDVDTPDLVFVTPWDGRIEIPSFDNETENLVSVVVAEPGSPILLENPRPLAEHIAAAAEWTPEDVDPVTAIATIRDDVAAAYGLSSQAVDASIQSWGSRSDDSYDRGLAAFAATDFSAATAALAESLAGTDAADARVFDRAFFLGQSLSAEDRHAEAVTAYRRAERPGDADSLLLLAWARASWRSDDYTQADELFRRALELEEVALGPRHPRVGAILTELAALYRIQGRYGQALPLLERAVEIGEDAFGPDDPLVGQWLDSLARLYRARRRYADAEPLFRRALAIAETELGSEHPSVADRLNQLADLVQVQGRYPEAETLFIRALAITEVALGPDHPTVGIRLNNLAMVYQAQHRYAAAEELFQRALPILETTLGPSHINVTSLLQNYGMLLREMGRPEEGAALEARAAATRGR